MHINLIYATMGSIVLYLIFSLINFIFLKFVIELFALLGMIHLVFTLKYLIPNLVSWTKNVSSSVHPRHLKFLYDALGHIIYTYIYNMTYNINRDIYINIYIAVFKNIQSTLNNEFTCGYSVMIHSHKVLNYISNLNIYNLRIF